MNEAAPYGIDDFCADTSVSRETRARLEAYDATLLDWSSRMNLIARSTLEDRWRRHFLDSAQICPLIPDKAARLYDIGSGAGFPALVLAAMAKERSEPFHVTTIESVGKKSSFLRAAADDMGLDNVHVKRERAESLKLPPADVITARACAGLDKLLGYAAPFAGENTIFLFPKGQDVEFELTQAAKSWIMDVERVPSRTSSDSAILKIRQLSPR